MEWLLCCWHALVEGDDGKKWGRRNGQVVPHHSQMRDFKWGSTPLFCIFWRSLFQVQMGQTETQLGPKCRYPNYVHGNPEQVCYLLHVYLIVGMSSELTNIKSLWRNNKNWTEDIYIYLGKIYPILSQHKWMLIEGWKRCQSLIQFSGSIPYLLYNNPDKTCNSDLYNRKLRLRELKMISLSVGSQHLFLRLLIYPTSQLQFLLSLFPSRKLLRSSGLTVA